MRVFKTKPFACFAAHEGIDDDELCDAVRRAGTAFFVCGFAKNDRANIKRDELKAFRKLADQMLGYDDQALAAAMDNGTITEFRCHG